jgi:hypothetical protein
MQVYVMMDENTYVAPDPEFFCYEGIEAVEEFELKDESDERGEGKNTIATPMSVLDTARYAEQIRFINETTAKLLIVAFAQENTVQLCNTELTVTANAAGFAELSVQHKRDLLLREFPAISVEFTLDTELGQCSKVTQDVPEGAEGFWFLWFAINGDALHFCARQFVQKKRNLKFKTLGWAEGKF